MSIPASIMNALGKFDAEYGSQPGNAGAERRPPSGAWACVVSNIQIDPPAPILNIRTEGGQTLPQKANAIRIQFTYEMADTECPEFPSGQSWKGRPIDIPTDISVFPKQTTRDWYMREQVSRLRNAYNVICNQTDAVTVPVTQQMAELQTAIKAGNVVVRVNVQWDLDKRNDPPTERFNIEYITDNLSA